MFSIWILWKLEREREREIGEERSRAKDLFVKRPKNPLDRKSRKKVSRINQGFLFSLEKYRSNLYPLYCFDRGVYKFPWENFYFEKFFDRCIRCNVAVEKIFFFLFFFHYYFDTIKYSLFDFRNAKT